MVSWALLNTFGLPLGIWLLRNGHSYYSSLRASYSLRKPTIRDTPPKTSRALNLLFSFALIALFYTLPYFSPPNIFKETSSKLQTPTEILFARLTALRTLTPVDISLRTKLTAKNSRLTYFAFGPDVVATCTFCSSSDPTSFFYYALPNLAAPHLLHLAVLGLATSSLLCGLESARWRTHAVLAGLALGFADVYLHMSYDLNANSLATGTHDIDFFFWRMRIFRGVFIAAIDGLLGWITWLSSTNRFFLAPPSLAHRVETASRALDAANFRLWATGNIRNATVRDLELRDNLTKYWQEEKNIYEAREVVTAIQSALERTDLRNLSQIADARSSDIVRSIGS